MLPRAAFLLLALSLVAASPRPAARANSLARAAVAASGGDALDNLHRSAGASTDGPSRPVLELALAAARCALAGGDVLDPATLTVIDYSRPSIEERLWVFDLRSGELVHRELVAHGEGTGADLATRFSNEPDSHQSSLGLFVTDAPYVGKHGYSLRLRGLEPGVNDRAWERAIVIHGAEYVSRGAIASLGRLGRSWGCPAVRPAVARGMIDRIKGGGLVFAYYPDPEWLASSRFLGACAASRVQATS